MNPIMKIADAIRSLTNRNREEDIFEEIRDAMKSIYKSP